MKLNIELTNPDVEKDGAWVEWKAANGVSVKMRRHDSKENVGHFINHSKKHRKVAQSENIEKQRALMIEFIIKYIIVDWKGLTEDNGKEFKYSKENAMIALTKSMDFYSWVFDQSNNINNFDWEDIDDTNVKERGEELKK